jgi:hypothetical protein
MTTSVSAWIMPATGVLPPERTLVAVRAIAPVRHHRREQRLDRAEHRDRQRGREQRQDEIGPEPRHLDVGQTGRNTAKADADRLDRKTCGGDNGGADNECHDVARDSWYEPVPHDDQRQHPCRDQRGRQRCRIAVHGELGHPRHEFSRHRANQCDAEEVFDLRAGDDQRDTVGEADDDRPGNETDSGPRSGQAHDDENRASHHGAHEQAVDAVLGDDA